MWERMWDQEVQAQNSAPPATRESGRAFESFSASLQWACPLLVLADFLLALGATVFFRSR